MRNVMQTRSIALIIAIILIAAAVVLPFAVQPTLEGVYAGTTELSFTYEGTADLASIRSEAETLLGRDVTVESWKDAYRSGPSYLTLTAPGLYDAARMDEVASSLEGTFSGLSLTRSVSGTSQSAYDMTFFVHTGIAALLLLVLLLIYLGLRFHKRLGGFAVSLTVFLSCLSNVALLFLLHLLIGTVGNALLLGVWMVMIVTFFVSMLLFGRVSEAIKRTPKRQTPDLQAITLAVVEDSKRAILLGMEVVCGALVVMLLVCLVTGMMGALGSLLPLAVAMVGAFLAPVSLTLPLWCGWRSRSGKASKA